VDSQSSATPWQSNDVASPPVSSQTKNYLHFGSFHLDVEGRELFKDGLRIRVQSKVIEALLILVEHPGQIISRQILRTRLWPSDTQINYDANVNTTVNKLRHVLGDSHDRPVYVETIPRRGYTFIANAEFVEQPPVFSRDKGVPPDCPKTRCFRP
jgi:DNA-binding winged helix-turn-helix (wHTH) protein